jgi:hypothetical protein
LLGALERAMARIHVAEITRRRPTRRIQTPPPAEM